MALPTYEYKDMLVRLENGVAVVTLNRAKERNTFSETLTLEMIEAFDLFDRDDRVRVVVLTAEHTAPAFCSGADLSNGWGDVVKGSGGTSKQHPQAYRDGGGAVTLAILRCRKITISAVNGHAAGVGVTGLQLPFDFRFIWAGAKLALPFVRIGVSPEGVSTYLLPRLLGHSRASALLLSGGVVAATSPLLQGLYHSVYPTREEVFPAALKFAQELAANTSQTAVAVTKALLWRGASSPEEQYLLESRAFLSLSSGNDAGEGAKAFIEKRRTKFTDTLSEGMPSWIPWWREINTQFRKTKL